MIQFYVVYSCFTKLIGALPIYTQRNETPYLKGFIINEISSSTKQQYCMMLFIKLIQLI